MDKQAKVMVGKGSGGAGASGGLKRPGWGGADLGVVPALPWSLRSCRNAHASPWPARPQQHAGIQCSLGSCT
ncbi:hypothetical protein ABPG77_000269 [Micractinium sp. CCAP 211/92]